LFGVELTGTQKAWMAIGFLGQALFTARMLVQWWASERAGKSIVPPAFWWLSLLGSSLLLAYAIYRFDPVIILGQVFGPIVYSRNLILLARPKPATAPQESVPLRRAA
jgi:lipid-A-disaccharide synthase-like uncharacterized protein